MPKYINARKFLSYTAETFSAHLREIRNHTSRLNYKRKKEAKERAKVKFEYGKEPKEQKAWSLSFNKKGTPVLRISGRKPQYLTENEYSDVLTLIDNRETLDALLKRRGIEVRLDDTNDTKSV